MSTPTNDAALTMREGAALVDALPQALMPVGAGLKDPVEWGGGLTGYGLELYDALAPAVARIKADAIAAERARVLAILDAGDPTDRMDAYYYSFERTNVGLIDRILTAVAIAGKGAHHTEMWTDDGLAGHYDDGLTHEQRIQKAADHAATTLRDQIGGQV